MRRDEISPRVPMNSWPAPRIWLVSGLVGAAAAYFMIRVLAQSEEKEPVTHKPVAPEITSAHPSDDESERIRHLEQQVRELSSRPADLTAPQPRVVVSDTPPTRANDGSKVGDDSPPSVFSTPISSVLSRVRQTLDDPTCHTKAHDDLLAQVRLLYRVKRLSQEQNESLAEAKRLLTIDKKAKCKSSKNEPSH